MWHKINSDIPLWRCQLIGPDIQSYFFNQNFTHIFGYKKNDRPKKNPSSNRMTIIYKTSEKNFKLIGQASLKLQ